MSHWSPALSVAAPQPDGLGWPLVISLGMEDRGQFQILMLVGVHSLGNVSDEREPQCSDFQPCLTMAYTPPPLVLKGTPNEP
jgi:hypothetical protein